MRTQIQVEENEQLGLTEIIRKMSELRVDAVSKEKISGTQSEEYMDLTKQLAAQMSAAEIQEKVQEIKTAVKEDGRAWQFDPMQSEYWKEKSPYFYNKLNELTVAVLGDNFSGLNDSVHVFNAAKYLLGSGEIKPFFGGVDDRTGALERIASLFLGQTFNAQRINPLTIEIDTKGNELSFGELKDLIKKASQMGYAYLNATMLQRDFDKIIAENKDVKLIKEVEKEKSIKGAKKAALYGIKATMPVSYFLIGCLPASLQKRIEESFTDERGKKKIDVEDKVSLVSILGGLVGGVGVAIAGFATANPIVVGVGSYAAIESGARMGILLNRYSENRYNYDTKKPMILGSLPVKAICYPIEKILERHDARGPVVKSRIVLRDMSEEQPSDFTNVFDSLSKFAQFGIPKKVLDTLTNSEKEYGKEFAEFIKQKAEEMNGRLETQEFSDKTSKTVTLTNTSNLGEYQKVTSVVYSPTDRYVISCIAQNKIDPKSLTSILTSQKTDEEKGREIRRRFKADYVHISRYVSEEDAAVELKSDITFIGSN